jgi:hypothetical protein
VSALTAPQHHTMNQGETNRLYVDWGENTAAEKTGALSAGDTVASCVVAVYSRPSGALQAGDPTLGSVTVPTNTSSDDINGRVWSNGEATVCTIATGASQTVGTYVLKFTATTTNSYVLPRFVKVEVRGTP